MDLDNVDSYPELGIEYSLPFFMRATGFNKHTEPVEYPQGYNRHYLLIVLEGKCIFKPGRYTYHLNKGDGFFVRAFFPFSYKSDSDKCKTQWMSFDGYATIPLFSTLKHENYMIYHNLDTYSLSMDMTKMYLTSINTDDTGRLLNSAMVYKVMIEVFAQSEEGKLLSKDNYSGNAMLIAKRYIEQNYSKDISQSDISKAVGISPQYLCRMFSAQMNTTPIKYLNHVRIEQAKYLLCKTDLTVREISEKVGYATPHYFSSVFRKLCGNTPTEYRRMAYIAANSN